MKKFDSSVALSQLRGETVCGTSVVGEMHNSVIGKSDVLANSGTSEGVIKSWEVRHNALGKGENSHGIYSIHEKKFVKSLSGKFSMPESESKNSIAELHEQESAERLKAADKASNLNASLDHRGIAVRHQIAAEKFRNSSTEPSLLMNTWSDESESISNAKDAKGHGSEKRGILAYNGYEIHPSGDNFKVKHPNGWFMEEEASNHDTAKKWVDSHIAESKSSYKGLPEPTGHVSFAELQKSKAEHASGQNRDATGDSAHERRSLARQGIISGLD